MIDEVAHKALKRLNNLFCVAFPGVAKDTLYSDDVFEETRLNSEMLVVALISNYVRIESGRKCVPTCVDDMYCMYDPLNLTKVDVLFELVRAHDGCAAELRRRLSYYANDAEIQKRAVSSFVEAVAARTLTNFLAAFSKKSGQIAKIQKMRDLLHKNIFRLTEKLNQRLRQFYGEDYTAKACCITVSKRTAKHLLKMTERAHLESRAKAAAK